MRRIEDLLARRAAVASWYAEALADVEELTTPRAAEWARPAWFVLHLRCGPGVDRDRLVEHCNRNGVEAKAYFEPPIHRQPPYAGRDDLVPAPLIETDLAASRTLIVPFFAAMSGAQDERVAAVLRQGLGR
jgi:dTDP-4-amino-4,6-dideoxygalactose transaminase